MPYRTAVVDVIMAWSLSQDLNEQVAYQGYFRGCWTGENEAWLHKPLLAEIGHPAQHIRLQG